MMIKAPEEIERNARDDLGQRHRLAPDEVERAWRDANPETRAVYRVDVCIALRMAGVPRDRMVRPQALITRFNPDLNPS